MSTIREQTAQRNERILDDYYDQGKSLAALSKSYGLDRCTIQKIIKIHEAMADAPRARAAKTVDPRVLKAKKPLSSTHYWIGMRIGRYMSEHKLLASEMAPRISKSRVAVVNMQIGAFDLTLLDITTLSRVLDIPYQELVLGELKEVPLVP